MVIHQYKFKRYVRKEQNERNTSHKHNPTPYLYFFANCEFVNNFKFVNCCESVLMF